MFKSIKINTFEGVHKYSTRFDDTHEYQLCTEITINDNYIRIKSEKADVRYNNVTYILYIENGD